jgi:hypothetical protein
MHVPPRLPFACRARIITFPFLPTPSALKTPSSTSNIHHSPHSHYILILTQRAHNTTPRNDAHNILLPADNAALLTLHATALLTTIRALLQCNHPILQLRHVVPERKEASDTTTRVQTKSRNANTRRRNNREDKKWEARGEQIQQLDFVSERKRWEALKARQAPPEEEDIVEEDAMLPTEMTEADYVAAQEEYELQQLVAMREEEEKRSSRHYGSDDEDYDSIFMECATAGDEWDQQQQQSQQQQLGFGSGEEMDMDMTYG